MTHSGNDRASRDSCERNVSRSQEIESRDLFAERKEVKIRHEGQVYRLRITKNGKLILNK